MAIFDVFHLKDSALGGKKPSKSAFNEIISVKRKNFRGSIDEKQQTQHVISKVFFPLWDMT